jgi:hypothetical protein
MGTEPDVLIRYYRVNPRQIVLLKSLLDGYEGLVVVRTENPAEGIVQLLISPDFAVEVEEIVKDLSRKIWIQAIADFAPSTGGRFFR